MAQAASIKFGKAMILLSDMGSPAVFSAPCGVESLTLNVTVNTNDTNIPDCADPDLPSWLVSDIVSKRMSLDFEGMLDQQAMQVWQDWWLNDEPSDEVDVRFFRDLTSGQGGGYFQAPAILAPYSETATRGNRWRNSGTLLLQGKPTFTAAT